ncbi:uncharacterized protein LOC142528380 [Primulina tabacum]|uniref:uncharacterized protein LOC142528380 n=1 Tax=Primulina tabacum TaxID=48773 RepID=UPI003F5AB884
MTKESVNPDSSVISYNILIYGKEAITLIDTGATHSFMSEVFMHSISVEPTVMPLHFNIVLPSGDEICSINIINACPVQVGNRLLFADLIVIPMVVFDVILGMDWLSAYCAVIYCVGMTVKFLADDHDSDVFVGLGFSMGIPIISCLQANKLLHKGFMGFLASVVDVRKESNLQLQDIDVIQDYPDVFADDMLGLPPDREVKFVIDLIPGTAPISKAPYRMAPTEMKELKTQLQELLDKGFIRPSSSLWGAPVLFVMKKDGSLRLCVNYRELNKLLMDKQLYAKLKKCAFWLEQVAFLGHIVSKEGISVDPSKVESIKQWFIPKTVSEEQQLDTQLLELKRKSDLTGVSKFGLNRDGLLTFRGKICVPMGDGIRKDVLLEAHTTPYSVKIDHQRLAGLLQSFPIPKSYHSQSDGQSERVIQILEDMLRACTIDFPGSWDSKLPLVEFTYNNSYQSSIGMAPYEALYGRKCRSPLFWEEVGERKMLDQELVQQTADVVALIQERMRTAHSGQKSYADVRRRPLEFEIGDRAYRLALPPDLDRVHNVFHVSMIRKYLSNPSHVVWYDSLDLLPNLSYEKMPIQILDRKVKVLRNKEIGLVKVLWRNQVIEEATWEPEEEMKHRYPSLFDGFPSRSSLASIVLVVVIKRIDADCPRREKSYSNGRETFELLL